MLNVASRELHDSWLRTKQRDRASFEQQIRIQTTSEEKRFVQPLSMLRATTKASWPRVWISRAVSILRFSTRQLGNGKSELLKQELDEEEDGAAKVWGEARTTAIAPPSSSYAYFVLLLYELRKNADIRNKDELTALRDLIEKPDQLQLTRADLDAYWDVCLDLDQLNRLDWQAVGAGLERMLEKIYPELSREDEKRLLDVVVDSSLDSFYIERSDIEQIFGMLCGMLPEGSTCSDSSSRQRPRGGGDGGGDGGTAGGGPGGGKGGGALICRWGPDCAKDNCEKTHHKTCYIKRPCHVKRDSGACNMQGCLYSHNFKLDNNKKPISGDFDANWTYIGPPTNKPAAHPAEQTQDYGGKAAGKGQQQVCRRFLIGRCDDATKCGRVHDEEAKKKYAAAVASNRVIECRFYPTGECKAGNSCIFLHDGKLPWKSQQQNPAQPTANVFEAPSFYFIGDENEFCGNNLPRHLPPHLDGPTVHAAIGEIEEPAEASTARDPEGSVPAHTHRRESSLAEADTTSTGMPYLLLDVNIDKFQKLETQVSPNAPISLKASDKPRSDRNSSPRSASANSIMLERPSSRGSSPRRDRIDREASRRQDPKPHRGTLVRSGPRDHDNYHREDHKHQRGTPSASARRSRSPRKDKRSW